MAHSLFDQTFGNLYNGSLSSLHAAFTSIVKNRLDGVLKILTSYIAFIHWGDCQNAALNEIGNRIVNGELPKMLGGDIEDEDVLGLFRHYKTPMFDVWVTKGNIARLVNRNDFKNLKHYLKFLPSDVFADMEAIRQMYLNEAYPDVVKLVSEITLPDEKMPSRTITIDDVKKLNAGKKFLHRKNGDIGIRELRFSLFKQDVLQLEELGFNPHPISSNKLHKIPIQINGKPQELHRYDWVLIREY